MRYQGVLVLLCLLLNDETNSLSLLPASNINGYPTVKFRRSCNQCIRQLNKLLPRDWKVVFEERLNGKSGYLDKRNAIPNSRFRQEIVMRGQDEVNSITSTIAANTPSATSSTLKHITKGISKLSDKLTSNFTATFPFGATEDMLALPPAMHGSGLASSTHEELKSSQAKSITVTFTPLFGLANGIIPNSARLMLLKGPPKITERSTLSSTLSTSEKTSIVSTLPTKVVTKTKVTTGVTKKLVSTSETPTVTTTSKMPIVNAEPKKLVSTNKLPIVTGEPKKLVSTNKLPIVTGEPKKLVSTNKMPIVTGEPKKLVSTNKMPVVTGEPKKLVSTNKMPIVTGETKKLVSTNKMPIVTPTINVKATSIPVLGITHAAPPPVSINSILPTGHAKAEDNILAKADTTYTVNNFISKIYSIPVNQTAVAAVVNRRPMTSNRFNFVTGSVPSPTAQAQPLVNKTIPLVPPTARNTNIDRTVSVQNPVYPLSTVYILNQVNGIGTTGISMMGVQLPAVLNPLPLSNQGKLMPPFFPKQTEIQNISTEGATKLPAVTMKRPVVVKTSVKLNKKSDLGAYSTLFFQKLHEALRNVLK